MKLLLKRKLLLGLGILFFAAFIGFSYLVAKETFTQLDFDLTVKFQDKIPRRFDEIFSWFSVLGSAEVSMTIWLTLVILTLFKRLWWTTLALFSLPLALAMEVYGKLFVQHPAPPFMFYRGVVDVNFPINFTHTNYSYPSGHETRTAFIIVFLMLYFYFRLSKKVQIFVQPTLLGILVIMTVSRIYLGEHWSTDVFGGFLVGVAFGILSGATVPLKKKIQIEEKPTSS